MTTERRRFITTVGAPVAVAAADAIVDAPTSCGAEGSVMDVHRLDASATCSWAAPRLAEPRPGQLDARQLL